MMKRWWIVGLSLVLALGLTLKFSAPTRADELADIEKQLGELKKSYEMSVAATTPLENEVDSLNKKLKSIQNSIEKATKDLENLEKSIFNREVDLEFQSKLLEERVRSWYIRRQLFNPLAMFLSTHQDAGEIARELTYRQAAAEQDKQIILKVGTDLTKLQEDKKKVEEDKVRLAAVKKQADTQAKFLGGEIAKAKEYQKNLSGQIAELNAKQQSLLAAKTGTFTTSVGDVPFADDPASRPDYNPGFSPAFAAFSFGAPHYKGMSQYGARGRARSGQNEEQILKAYYGNVKIETRNDLPGSINTSVGSLPFEDNYLMGIAEMPSNWEDNNLAALKSQAIAARTYALSYIGWRIGSGGGGGNICVTEQCQVYSKSKAANVPGAWRKAVQETKGKVVVSNNTNQIFATWYSASSGGYQESYESLGHRTPGMWDTACGNQGCWTGEAYEKKGESPWFYKGWYKSRGGQTCGRKHPWLNQEEFADIVNSILIAKNDGGAVNHLSQVDDACLGNVPDTWSKGKVKEEAAKYGGPVSKVTGVKISYGTDGVTANVHLDTDKGGYDFSGKDFKLIFNLRAPGVVHLKSGLFNIEKK